MSDEDVAVTHTYRLDGKPIIIVLTNARVEGWYAYAAYEHATVRDIIADVYASSSMDALLMLAGKLAVEVVDHE